MLVFVFINTKQHCEQDLGLLYCIVSVFWFA